MSDPAPTAKQPTTERRATVRIDAEPSGKKFQGTWLEFADGSRWVIDYRPRTPWTWFRDAEVVFTGECYEPFGQAISANHFRVDRMRFATKPELGAKPYLELGPERELRGTFVDRAFAPGSKAEGSTQKMFDVDGGGRWEIVGVEGGEWPADGTKARIDAREVTPDMAHHAQTSGPKLWVMSTSAYDTEKDPAYAPRLKPCPE